MDKTYSLPAVPLSIHHHDPGLYSPAYVQISSAAAITLGMMQGLMHRTACTHCLNLLLTYPEGCRANCSYCGLARHREESRAYQDRNFIRVHWPSLSLKDIIQRVKNGADGAAFERMCISMISHPRANADTFHILEQWVAQLPHIPVSILSNPTTLSYADLVLLKQLGADIFTVALDAVTPDIFERTRGKTVQSPHRWDKYWQTIEWAAEIFGAEKFGAHLICGMGETEQEILQVVQQIYTMGGHSHMFAFFPERGSLMEDWEAVPFDQWRRVQLARFLIDYRQISINDMGFNAQGQVIDFGVNPDVLTALVDSGKPFRTSGCPGKHDPEISACDRPYGDSTPQQIRSYPFPLLQFDVRRVKQQLGGSKQGFTPKSRNES